jgi:protein-L-isoaspartate O-methyltransferase
VTAAPDLIPPPLIHQLKAGGKMVVPAGLPDAQQLVRVEKHSNGRVTTREILQVRFSRNSRIPNRADAPSARVLTKIPGGEHLLLARRRRAGGGP